MELRRYYTTALEDWVTKFYTRLNIFYPYQIDPSFIARKMSIFLREKPFSSTHQVVGRFRCIVVDSRLSKKNEKPSFMSCVIFSVTPVCKVCRNTIHMLKFIDLSTPYTIEQMSNVFKVTPTLCKERLIQIRNRVLLKLSHIEIFSEKSITF
ncbi:hypothetical protein GFC29_3081 [Anoxybacillus sp. B7M1]|uniref:peptidase n=1 Tax=unclassified Anoxybacillus TaxID=2639704 RepID=UPI0007B5CCDB|nr:MULTISPECIES: peptidase [unclassified Anoxybacillus]ANB58686.1 hypothetical protein GFC28_2355 [Anoxybacillus sp. B2M1]ANB64236.1 hypothetical protein GFC29_3081 [Anoxybacillus sp. B7M1]